jgi:regulatory protein
VKVTKTLDADPYLVALRLLAGRDYTVTAITKKLLTRGYDEGRVVSAVDRLVSDRFLDDRRYGERFVESARSCGRYVGYRLRQELQRCGIAKDLIGELLPGQQDQAEEVAMAAALVARRYSKVDLAKATDQERRRIAGFLQRRGFTCGVVKSLFESHHFCG